MIDISVRPDEILQKMLICVLLGHDKLTQRLASCVRQKDGVVVLNIGDTIDTALRVNGNTIDEWTIFDTSTKRAYFNGSRFAVVTGFPNNAIDCHHLTAICPHLCVLSLEHELNHLIQLGSEEKYFGIGRRGLKNQHEEMTARLPIVKAALKPEGNVRVIKGSKEPDRQRRFFLSRLHEFVNDVASQHPADADLHEHLRVILSSIGTRMELSVA